MAGTEADPYEFVAPSSKLKSSVWRYFGFYKKKGSNETHYDRTLCKLCNNLLAYIGGCTTNMRYHLIRSHKIHAAPWESDVKTVTANKDGKKVQRFSNLEKVDKGVYEFVNAPSSHKALVWQYFGLGKEKGKKDPDTHRTWCKLCDAFIAYTGGNTSNMRSHLAVHHDIQFESVTVNSKREEPTKTDSTEIDRLDSDKYLSDNYEFVAAKPELKASVWIHFGFYRLKGTDETRFDRTCCNLCKILIRYIDGNTSNMRAHLQRNHGIEYSGVPKVKAPPVKPSIWLVKDVKVC